MPRPADIDALVKCNWESGSNQHSLFQRALPRSPQVNQQWLRGDEARPRLKNTQRILCIAHTEQSLIP